MKICIEDYFHATTKPSLSNQVLVILLLYTEVCLINLILSTSNYHTICSYNAILLIHYNAILYNIIYWIDIPLRDGSQDKVSTFTSTHIFASSSPEKGPILTLPSA